MYTLNKDQEIINQASLHYDVGNSSNNYVFQQKKKYTRRVNLVLTIGYGQICPLFIQFNLCNE